MHIRRSTRLPAALLALLSFGTSAATPSDSLPAPATPVATTPPPAAATPAPSTSTAPPPAPAPAATAAPAEHAVPPVVAPVGNEQDRAAVQSHQPPPAVAAQPADATPRDQAAAIAQAASPGDPSGFRLMTLSTNALLSRVSLADHAEHSIDMQYYIFRSDATGRLVALHVLEAADRGVRVRILLDDLNLADDVAMFQALDAHPGIEVRLFNPLLTRDPTAVSKAAQFLLEFRRLNRRMHNKSFIVDNNEAVIGGRNIGDGYFDANATNNFRDLDLLAIGPVVPAATATFESYWNSDAAHPLSEYHSKAHSDNGLAALRTTLEKNARKFDASAYAYAAVDDLPNGASADRPGNWYWGPATLVADQPEKIVAESGRGALSIGPRLRALINGAQSEVLLISPYFIPSAKDERNFTEIAQRGVAFKVLTNSLASNDVLAAHEGYSDHRRALLKGGVQLFELKPAPGVEMAAADAGASSGVSLHAKSFVVDRRYVFIGSLNMDQRSKLLNTEMGVVVDSPQLAKAVAEFFGTATLPANAYHVVLGARDGSHPTELHWQASKDGKDVDYDSEPDATLRKRAEVLLLKLLPIDGLL